LVLARDKVIHCPFTSSAVLQYFVNINTKPPAKKRLVFDLVDLCDAKCWWQSCQRRWDYPVQFWTGTCSCFIKLCAAANHVLCIPAMFSMVEKRRKLVFATKAHIDNRKKNLLKSNTSTTCPDNTVNFGLLVAAICWRVDARLQFLTGFASWHL